MQRRGRRSQFGGTITSQPSGQCHVPANLCQEGVTVSPCMQACVPGRGAIRSLVKFRERRASSFRDMPNWIDRA
jgi:hypothetical protein